MQSRNGSWGTVMRNVFINDQPFSIEFLIPASSGGARFNIINT